MEKMGEMQIDEVLSRVDTPNMEDILQQIESLERELEEISRRKEELIDAQRMAERYGFDKEVKKLKSMINREDKTYEKIDKQRSNLYIQVSKFEKEVLSKVEPLLSKHIIGIPQEIEALWNISPQTPQNEILQTIQKVKDLPNTWDKEREHFKKEFQDAFSMYTKNLESRKSLQQIKKYDIFLGQTIEQYNKNQTNINQIKTTISALNDLNLENTPINKLIAKIQRVRNLSIT